MDSNEAFVQALPKLLAQTQKELTGVVKSQQFLSGKFDDILDFMKSLKAEIQKLRTENDNLKQSLKHVNLNANSISKAVDRAEQDIDNHNRMQLSCNAIMLGVPSLPQEDTEDIVAKACAAIGYNNVKADIVSCCRIRDVKNNKPPIRIVFKNEKSKEHLLTRKKAHGPLETSAIDRVSWPIGTKSNVIIRDDLSPLSMRILQELKSIQHTLNIRYVWPGRNGAIMVRLTANSKAIPIHSRQELQQLMSLIHK